MSWVWFPIHPCHLYKSCLDTHCPPQLLGTILLTQSNLKYILFMLLYYLSLLHICSSMWQVYFRLGKITPQSIQMRVSFGWSPQNDLAPVNRICRHLDPSFNRKGPSWRQKKTPRPSKKNYGRVSCNNELFQPCCLVLCVFRACKVKFRVPSDLEGSTLYNWSSRVNLCFTQILLL